MKVKIGMHSPHVSPVRNNIFQCGCTCIDNIFNGSACNDSIFNGSTCNDNRGRLLLGWAVGQTATCANIIKIFEFAKKNIFLLK